MYSVIKYSVIIMERVLYPLKWIHLHSPHISKPQYFNIIHFSNISALYIVQIRYFLLEHGCSMFARKILNNFFPFYFLSHHYFFWGVDTSGPGQKYVKIRNFQEVFESPGKKMLVTMKIRVKYNY